MNVKKADFGGFGVGIDCRTVDLNAVVLKDYRLVEEGARYVDRLPDDSIYKNMPALQDLHFSGVAENCKIARVNEDFSVTDIVPFRHGELGVCGCKNDSVIYYERTRDNLIFKSTSSDNEYVAPYNAVPKCYNDVFVVKYEFDEDDCDEEDYEEYMTRVTAFDYDLNLLEQFYEETDYDCEDNFLNRNFRDDGDGLREKYTEFNDYIADLKNRHSGLIIDITGIERRFTPDFDSFVAACKDKRTKKNYLVKFDRDGDIQWQTEVSENAMSSDIYELDGNYLLLNYTDKSGRKWRLSKYSDSGVLLDSYDFNGEVISMTMHNGVPVIIYNDLANRKDWQKKLSKDTGANICPAAMLVICDE